LLQKDIFMAFLRCGIISYGGGPGAIPFIQKEVVRKYNWMTDEELWDIVALANALPGPLATKMAGYIGYRVGGVWGCVGALAATIIPTTLMMILLMTTLTHFSDYPWVQGMTYAMLPIVGVILGTLALQFLQAASKGLTWHVIAVHVVVIFVLTFYFGIHPALIIAVLLLWALFGKNPFERNEQKGGSS